ncbi:MAG: hypothetical protein V3V00_04695 [Saprospiraceae bacterium]
MRNDLIFALLAALSSSGYYASPKFLYVTENSQSTLLRPDMYDRDSDMSCYHMQFDKAITPCNTTILDRKTDHFDLYYDPSIISGLEAVEYLEFSNDYMGVLMLGRKITYNLVPTTVNSMGQIIDDFEGSPLNTLNNSIIFSSEARTTNQNFGEHIKNSDKHLLIVKLLRVDHSGKYILDPRIIIHEYLHMLDKYNTGHDMSCSSIFHSSLLPSTGWLNTYRILVSNGLDTTDYDAIKLNLYLYPSVTESTCCNSSVIDNILSCIEFDDKECFSGDKNLGMTNDMLKNYNIPLRSENAKEQEQDYFFMSAYDPIKKDYRIQKMSTDMQQYRVIGMKERLDYIRSNLIKEKEINLLDKLINKAKKLLFGVNKLDKNGLNNIDHTGKINKKNK